MSLLYRAMYRVGFTPWDTGEISSELRSVIEGPNALSPGRVMDIGCGTGMQSIYLAGHGWDVTGVDVVERPLRTARARAASEAERATFLRADITSDSAAMPVGQFDLFHDRGCFHGLTTTQRRAYVDAVTRCAERDSRLLLMSFTRHRVPGGPPGANRNEVIGLFEPHWHLSATTPDSDAAPRGPMRHVPRFWYLLSRST